MKLPVPTPRELRASFFVAAVLAFMLTMTLCWAIIHKVSQSDNVLHIAVANADQVQRLSEQLDAQATAAEAQHQADVARINQLIRGQRALTRVLRANGIAVPNIAYTPRPSGGGGGGSGPPKSPGPSSPTPAAPAGPGHSGTHACAHSPKC